MVPVVRVVSYHKGKVARAGGSAGGQQEAVGATMMVDDSSGSGSGSGSRMEGLDASNSLDDSAISMDSDLP